jgi:hypothetical protein
MRLTRTAGAGLLTAAAVALVAGGARGVEPGTYSAERSDAFVTVADPDGKPVLRYQREPPPAGEPTPSVEGACYTHPLYTPSGDLVTDVAPKDHPHHRGIFCAWVAVEGEQKGDWWGWGAKAPKDRRAVVPREARVTEQDEEGATLRLINSWRAEDETILGERVTLTVSRVPGCNVVDYEYKFTPPTRTPVTIAQNPFGGFCYRARPRGRQVITDADGKVIDRPDSIFDKSETNWPRSRWYDLTYHQADGKVSGVAVMDHPSNPLSTWHVVRGIHMLNPCIVAEEAFTIRFGEPLFLRYRVVAHDGDAAGANLPALYDDFVGEKKDQ